MFNLARCYTDDKRYKNYKNPEKAAELFRESKQIFELKNKLNDFSGKLLKSNLFYRFYIALNALKDILVTSSNK